ncbi:MAG: hypothetical protein QGI09_08905, partial [Dehalococcoidia bacterium]|nr:hypothetical protein [Dehalococcoidia bacterium]
MNRASARRILNSYLEVPVARFLAKLGLSPNIVTSLGLVLAGPSWGWTLEEAAEPYRGATLKVGVAFVPVVG